jgi:hypothetical protein
MRWILFLICMDEMLKYVLLCYLCINQFNLQSLNKQCHNIIAAKIMLQK